MYGNEIWHKGQYAAQMIVLGLMKFVKLVD